jgi:hypothetical protein
MAAPAPRAGACRDWLLRYKSRFSKGLISYMGKVFILNFLTIYTIKKLQLMHMSLTNIEYRDSVVDQAGLLFFLSMPLLI